MKTLLLGFLLCGIAWAQTTAHNGYWWKQLSEPQKAAYLQGYVDGVADGVMHLALKTNVKRVETIRATTEVVGPGTFGQLEEGLDKFYEDYRNTTIVLTGAIEYVNDDIGGLAAASLQRKLEFLRQMAAKDTTAIPSQQSVSH